MKVAEEGKIVTELFTSFPARELTNPKIFPSLLFYYGMLTMKGTRGSKLILGIPNNNVRSLIEDLGIRNEDLQESNI